ncbi:MAG: sulfurtransferase [Chloroflexi bacterium]|nr:sulfurtransferase [Chloroflexota bacterium]
MPKTFKDFGDEGRAVAPLISVDDAQAQMASHPETVVIDVRQEADSHGNAVPGAINIPLGQLAIRADTELPEAVRDARIQDRSTPIITTCGPGGQAAIAAKILHDMGFSDVKIMDGGTNAWKAAGKPVH